MRSPLLRIYAYRAASGFVPIAQLYSVLFAQKHLSTLEISTLIAAWSISALAFEVPSGVVADKWDRRLVLVFAQTSMVIAFALWIAFPHFWGYLIGFVIWGVGGALDSGTYEALVYDELSSRESEDKYVDVLGRSEAVYLLAVVAGSGFAALFVHRGYSILLWSSLIAALIGMLAAGSLPRAAKREEVEDDKYFAMLKRGISSALRTPVLARAIAVIALSGGVTDLVSEYAPLFASDRSISNTGVAVVGTVAVLVMAGVSAWAAKIPGAKLAPTLQLGVCGGLVVAASFSPTWVAIVLFNLSAALANAIWVVASAEMQHHVEGDIRATTTSVGGFMQELLNVISLFVVGVVADHFSRTTAFRFIGMAIIAVAMMLLALRGSKSPSPVVPPPSEA